MFNNFYTNVGIDNDSRAKRIINTFSKLCDCYVLTSSCKFTNKYPFKVYIGKFLKANLYSHLLGEQAHKNPAQTFPKPDYLEEMLSVAQ